MNSQDFKSKIIEIKDSLRNKEIEIKVFKNGLSEKFTFLNLKSFGLKILELENKGYDFTFSKVSHELAEFSLVEKVTIRNSKTRTYKTSFQRTLEYCIDNIPFTKMTISCYPN